MPQGFMASLWANIVPKPWFFIGLKIFLIWHAIIFEIFSRKPIDMADNIGIMKSQEKKREKKMEKVTSVNDFIRSLPRIVQKKVWKVTDKDGTVVQYVGATDNRKYTAQKYIDEKYPDKVLKLTFSHFNGMITVPR